MTLIYSSKVVEGLSGSYVDPFRFSGVEKGVTKVFADDEHIISAYKESGIEVSLITQKEEKPKGRNKVASE